MKCPVCGNDYHPYKWRIEYEPNGDAITARHNFFCPNCESEFSIKEYFKSESVDLDPIIFKKGDKSNFEPWLH